MAWTTPSTFVAGTTLTAATLNAQIRDNLNAAFPVGSIHYFMQAGTTTETLINGFALEMNAVSVLRATYANLNTLLSGLGYPFGTVDGTHMTLPDAKGRALYHAASGGNADVNAIAASDGLPVGSRSPQHNTTKGTLAITPDPHSHTYTTQTVAAFAATGAAVNSVNTTPSVNTGTTSLSITGAGGVGGTRPNDLTPWLVAGVYAVKT